MKISYRFFLLSLFCLSLIGYVYAQEVPSDASVSPQSTETTSPEITPPETPAAVPTQTTVPTETTLPTETTTTTTTTTQQETTAPETVPTSEIPASAISSQQPIKTILINFNNVSIIEFIRFISKITNKNFVFDELDLQFNVTIVSEEPTTIENIMSALLQVLRIHGLTLLEQGNNIVIHKAPGVNAIARVVADNLPPDAQKQQTEIVTRLFRLNTADSDKIAVLIRPLVSDKALVEVFKDTNHLIVTDIETNVNEVALLVKSLDSPNNGLVIGQFVVRNGFIDSLIQLAQRIMQPISQDQTLIFVPHRAANSIFIVSTPFMLERTIALLQYLDQNQGLTRILDLKDLRFTPEGTITGPSAQGQWVLDPQGNWVFRTGQTPGTPTEGPPQGYWYVDDQGNWRFQTGTPPPTPEGQRGIGIGPEGRWVLDPQGFWVFQLAQGKSISPERTVRPQRGVADLPLGHIERTRFFIYKLNYRKGEQVQVALARIGHSLRISGTSNEDLNEAIDSVQWIESSNSLIFTGTGEALDKVQELLLEIDTPLRQVFIEMLILETTMDDALEYGVNWGTRSGGGNFATSQAFLTTGSPLPIALATAGLTGTPDAAALALAPGFHQGIVGRTLTRGGLEFTSIGALVTAIHDRSCDDIVMNPKILVEDNTTAEIFVGINTRFPTQSIVNDQGVIVTQNFEFRDVGTLLRITPLIGNNDIITLTLREERSSVIATDTNVGESGPTTSLSRTTTRVHIPNEFFLVISGMMQEEDLLVRNNVPCLGGVPFIGAAFARRVHNDQRRNVMIFLRPMIIDTQEEIDNVTKHQQDIWRYKKRAKPMWKYEVDEALDYFNLPPQINCCEDQCKYTGCCDQCD